MLVLLLPGSPACGPARRRRQELVLGQLCLLGSLLLLLSSLSCWAGSAGSDVLSYTMETNDKWHGRKLLQEVEENATEIPEDDEHQYIKNCTEPGKDLTKMKFHSLKVPFIILFVCLF
ncbi:hypothetical protein Y1Q_0010503 [Alligator mississippiensis]|uniref:Uncharacterized protein n=1 Tax=Alligator mississippiensis TaxID=8496 RepID=A0A151NDE7_ALLMI|nr:hypothetical protein Y1Q_0010503 [Alligator mississippiensis]